TEIYADLDAVHVPVSPHREITQTASSSALALEVDINVKNVDYALAKCCNPQPGDPIFGFISVLKGIRIHHCDCPNAINMRERFPYRVIPARWKERK
ncbi:MAG: bifunctional (p)ppGpp synthetase/guanosine-3',5'-bis(diphosphate) 3'-pyrophosphohydrolase, partial [Paludibacteraceae bacterium]|nr:bifunctional (p)ppGpp synthetase/guanosine-3',5'-bis(diphosphate) 3'-pyrophosphohydrolase [Paludibacteraceae bacterium]